MRKVIHDQEPRILDAAVRGENYGYDDTDDENADDTNNRGNQNSFKS